MQVAEMEISTAVDLTGARGARLQGCLHQHMR
jgi:hypothetical protein